MPSPVEISLKDQWKRNNDVIIAGLIIGIVLLIIIPLPAWLLDILLIISIMMGLVILLITMFTTEPLQFSVFPSLLLITTLYRLSLNISSTRLILSEASAGKVIAAFGHFVVSGSYIVGAVIFIIITVIQFVVITNGAGRVAEVAARFTLDAMPGKQMSIDSEFNAGLITEEEARGRRRQIQREADLFGAMDGASKFVRGDAIASIIIIIINILGGLAIGLVQKSMPIEEALQVYTLLTVGDGLVTQVPALLVSTATGILVTRATSDASFGKDLSRQFLNFPKVLFLTAGILFILGLIPAMPNLLFLVLSGMTAYLAHSLLQSERQGRLAEQERLSRQMREKPQEPENVFNYFQIDPLEIEIGYNLITLTDEGQGGDLLYRLAAVRRQCASEMGIFVRPIRIRDNLQLGPNSYTFKLKGVPVAAGELLPGHFLAMDPIGQAKEVPGIPTFEPTFGLKAWWVNAAEREQIELLGFTVVDSTTVIITHLTEFIKRNAHELLGRQELRDLLDVVKEKNPAVVEELVPNLLSLGEIQKVLQNLLREQVPVRDLVTILEALADGARFSKDTDYLTEYVRQAMARSISRLYRAQGNGDKISVITLHPQLEQRVIDSLQQTQLGLYPVLDPVMVQGVVERLKNISEKLTVRGLAPVVLCSPRVRLPFRRLIERYFPGLSVLSLGEIAPGIEVEAVGTVAIE